MSFGSTSPALSDRSEFPLFYRTVAPDSSHNPARIAFIRRFGWDTVTTFSQNEEIHSLAVNDLVTEMENANISCAATITFAETDFKNQLKMLRVRDLFTSFSGFSFSVLTWCICTFAVTSIAFHSQCHHHHSVYCARRWCVFNAMTQSLLLVSFVK